MRLTMGLFMTVLALTFISAASQGAPGPYEVCQSPLLTRQEQDLCHEQISAAQTVAERKQVQTKFRNRVKAAEDAQKPKK